METVKFGIENGIAEIKLNRPKVLNSFNRDMALEVQQCLDKCNDKEVRVVVITGEGRSFCAGQDLAEAIAPGSDLRTIVRDHFNPVVRKIRTLEKPVVAAVNGIAAGAGANIALACDLTIATASAYFVQSFAKIGLIPDSGGTFLLPRLVGLQRASAMSLLADKISAEKAMEMGLIFKAVADDQFKEEVQQLVSYLAKQPTRGFWFTKKALNESSVHSFEEQLDLEEALQAEAGSTSDYREGVNAFLEKRAPNFSGN